jgi:Chemotaxis protein histidine kinase and related kinases
LRNAVVHGIESPDVRLSMGKPTQGKIEVMLQASNKQGYWRLTVRDDGMGLSPARIRDRLKAQGSIKFDELANMSDEELVRQVFRPDFSTASVVSSHAGRGVGLNLVRSLVKKLPSGYLKLTTNPDNYTEFSIDFQS